MPEEKSQEQLEYEQRLRRRLKILQKEFAEGKIRILKELEVDVKESLLAVKLRPDGEIDLDTADGVVRSLAGAVTLFHDREELKKSVSLSEIQKIYFEFIEQNFGHFYKKMMEKKLTPHYAASVLTQDPKFIEEATKNLDQFLSVVDEFWGNTGEIAHIHVEDMRGNVKGVFGGDLFPVHNENIASKCGIYTDTIVLPDPFLRSKAIFEQYNKKDQAYYLIKHGLSILKYKQLACADIEIPIVVILPDRTILENDEREFCYQLAEKDSLIHLEKLFGRKFGSFEELFEFAQDLDTVEKTVAKINDDSRVLFNTEWKGTTSTQLQKTAEDPNYKLFGTKSPGEILVMQSFSRMNISNELLIKSRRLNGTPIIEAPTSWQYLVWKMEYDAARAEQETNTHDLHVVRGLEELAGSEMEWLGNIPADALIEIRQQGAMNEIREILADGINDLISLNPTNFYRSRDKIFDNINQAFVQHKKNINELHRKQWKFAGKDIGSWLVTGSLAIAAVATGTPVWGLAAIAADQLLDAPKLKDIPQSIRELVDKNNEVHKSPVGMLFSISKKR